MKKLRKPSTIILSGIAITVLLCLSSCKNPEPKAGNDGQQGWPQYVRTAAQDLNCTDAERMETVNRIDRFFTLAEDKTTPAGVLCDSLYFLMDALENYITKDDNFEFTLLMRATAFGIHHSFTSNDERFQQCYCRWGVEDYWNTSMCIDSMDMEVMSTSCLRNAFEASYRFATMNVALTEGDSVSSLIVCNYIDKSFEDFECRLTRLDSTLVGVINFETAYIDSTDMQDGILRALFDTEEIANLLYLADMITIRYKADGELVELKSLAPYFFNEQVKECPRIDRLIYPKVRKFSDENPLQAQ